MHIFGALKNHDFLAGLIVIFTTITPLNFAKYDISDNHTLHSWLCIPALSSRRPRVAKQQIGTALVQCSLETRCQY
jgi:hypothetical protein